MECPNGKKRKRSPNRPKMAQATKQRPSSCLSDSSSSLTTSHAKSRMDTMIIMVVVIVLDNMPIVHWLHGCGSRDVTMIQGQKHASARSKRSLLTGTGTFGVSLSERPGRRTVWFLGLACRLPLLLLSPRLGSSCIFGLKDTSSAGLQEIESRFQRKGCR